MHMRTQIRNKVAEAVAPVSVGPVYVSRVREISRRDGRDFCAIDVHTDRAAPAASRQGRALQPHMRTITFSVTICATGKDGQDAADKLDDRALDIERAISIALPKAEYLGTDIDAPAEASTLMLLGTLSYQIQEIETHGDA